METLTRQPAESVPGPLDRADFSDRLERLYLQVEQKFAKLSERDVAKGKQNPELTEDDIDVLQALYVLIKQLGFRPINYDDTTKMAIDTFILHQTIVLKALETILSETSSPNEKMQAREKMRQLPLLAQFMDMLPETAHVFKKP